MKSNIITRIIIYSIIIVLLLAAMSVAILFRYYRVTPAHTNSAATSVSINADNDSVIVNSDTIQTIQISWAIGSISVESADVSAIQISEVRSNSAKPMHIDGQNTTLVIDYQESGSFSGLNIADHKELTILVPRKWSCKELVIDGASAEINLSGLTVQDVDINTASGECRMTDCDFGSLDVDSASGKVVFSGSLNEFNMDGASAKAELTLTNTPDSISMDSASGDLDLTLPTDCGFTASLDSLSGTIKTDTDLPLQMDDGRYRYGDGHCRIEMGGMSAGMWIHFSDHHSEDSLHHK